MTLSDLAVVALVVAVLAPDVRRAVEAIRQARRWLAAARPRAAAAQGAPMTPSDRVVAAADQPAGPAAGARVPGKVVPHNISAADHAGRSSSTAARSLARTHQPGQATAPRAALSARSAALGRAQRHLQGHPGGAAPVERTCGICGGPIDPDLDSWRWAAHLDSMVHADCIPAWLRAADRTASRGCCHGRGYVQLWLDEGDGMRLMNEAAGRQGETHANA